MRREPRAVMAPHNAATVRFVTREANVAACKACGKRPERGPLVLAGLRHLRVGRHAAARAVFERHEHVEERC